LRQNNLRVHGPDDANDEDEEESGDCFIGGGHGGLLLAWVCLKDNTSDRYVNNSGYIFFAGQKKPAGRWRVWCTSLGY
jgi:hypothetical protein